MKWKTESDGDDASLASPAGRMPRDDKKQPSWVMSFFLLVVLTLYTTFSFVGKTQTSIHNSYIEAYDTVSRQKLRPINIDDAHTRGVAHWATWVFVVDFKKETILLQKRSTTSVTCAGKWGVTGEHVEPGETMYETALRGLKEELDINANVKELILLENFLWKNTQAQRIDVQNSTVFLYPVTSEVHQIKVNEESDVAEFVPFQIFKTWCEEDPSKVCGRQYAQAFLKYMILICRRAPVTSPFCATHYHNQRALLRGRGL